MYADDLNVIKWYIDDSSSIHADFNSHTGGIMTYVRGVPILQSRKQQFITIQSTKSELVGADDMTTMILRTKFFIVSGSHPR